jgi:PEP-CTERM motif
MQRVLLAATILAAVGVSPVRAATVTVDNVGAILNQSDALPAESTPGQGVTFAQFFEFSLPTRETVTVSMSDSGTGNLAIVDGVLSLNTHTSTGPAPLFIPAGALIESSLISNVVGGQEATVTPDVLSAGDYFAEINGTSGSSRIRLAIDGTATAVQAIPEPSTWAMVLVGFGLISMFGLRRKPQTDLNSI